MCEYGDVRMIGHVRVIGYNVRVIMKCASASTVMCE